ncbi:putative adenylyltransferase/sulfurtransferase MoeZ [mine drainage metagenome]|uniref:Putative adenylyltransferase/sulfurtransferase MoeZ n=1 Tax=mine drainage metagenome TaxID=410659 RepID=A0A1J5QMU7_9ZZZZ
MPIRPVVEPGPALTAEQLRRYDRHLLLPGVGVEGQRRLRNSRVCVVGAGGLGSPVLLYLAAAGVGTIGIVDLDDVDESNLQRQVVHGWADVGRPKVDSARDAVLAVDAGIAVVVHAGPLTADNVEGVLSGYDVVVDGTDNVPTRYLVNDACVALGLPEVWGSVLRFDAQVSVFWGRPPVPGITAVQLRDLFPEAPPADDVPSCADAGVLGALCGQVGSVMATEVLKLLMGVGEPLLGRVLVIDALASRWTEVALAQAGAPAAGPVRAAAPSVRSSSPPTVSARELAALLSGPPARRPFVVDVREPTEHAIVAIPGARLIPLGRILDGTAFESLPRDRQIVLHCRTGARSAQALRAVLAAGFTDVVHLDGGILAWVDDVDPTLTRY